MTTNSIRSNAQRNSGLTLVETLLSVVLVGLLLSAVVVNFVGMERGSKLNEGATQVEALFRFARAHAANTGRIVQIRATEGSTNTPLARPSLMVLCESDPISRPGEFAPVPQSKLFVDQIQEQVCLEEFRIVQAEQAAAKEFALTNSPSATDMTAGTSLEEPLTEMPVISFFPDGSSDSAELVLLSLQEEEPRKVMLRLSGIIGTVERRHIYSDGIDATPVSSETESYEAALR